MTGPLKLKNHWPGLLLIAWCCFQATAQAEGAACTFELQAGVMDVRPAVQGEFKDSELSAMLERGYRLRLMPGQDAAAELLLHKAEDLARSRRNSCAEGMASYALGLGSLDHNFPEAESRFQNAESAFTSVQAALPIARTHFELALVDLWNQDKTKAVAHLRQAIPELESSGDARLALHARTELAIEEENEGVADATFSGLLEKARSLPHSEPLQGMILQQWGTIERRRGHMDTAMQDAEQALALFSACRCDLGEWGYTEITIGLAESSQGRHTSAIQHYRSAMQLFARANEHLYVPRALNNIGLEYAALHNPERSVAYYRKGLAAAKATHSAYYENTIAMSLAEAYVALKDWPHAIALERQAAAWAQTDRTRCIANSDLLWALVSAHEPAEAQKALDAARPACTAIQDQAGIAYLDELQAQLDLDAGRLDAALDFVKRAQVRIEEARAHLVPEDAHKLGYHERSIHIYNTLIAILTRMHRPEAALEAAEQARARAFLDLLESAQHGAVSDPAGASLPGLPQAARDNLLASASHAAPPTIAEMRATVARLHSTLLAYWIADDTLYIWVAQPDRPVFEATTKITESRLAKLVSATSPFARAHEASQHLATRGGEALPLGAPDPAAWRAMYQVLIAPIEAELPREPGSLITILPSGPLFQLAFAALLDNHNHYLIERYALHTVPSTGLLQFTARSDRAADALPPHFLFVANPAHFPAGPGGLRLPPLPGTDLEVRGVASLLPTSSVTLLEGRRAGIRDLMSGLPRATVLHFATHAIVSDKDPSSSFLALDRDQNGGELTTASIYGLHLHASLVVLSACRTGLGHITGDGVAGLSRAFFYAGSASVITTLWDVADAPTARLLPRFYRSLHEGQSRSASLRSAQLSLLSDLRRGRIQVQTVAGPMTLPENPAFWAAFSLSGEP